ncbi:MAG: acyl carrier protein [Deltaproteobacteria bacterium]|nr:acyl carrier protein [Deltaproteobacteria bacterium]MBW2392826.1 acyl carrier protein [Deltaproteobacteria bacterium]
MSPTDVLALLKRIMVREFDLTEDAIQLSSGFEELDMDSIDAVDLAVSVEEEIGFQFNTDDLAELRTIQNVVDLICGTRRSAAQATE